MRFNELKQARYLIFLRRFNITVATGNGNKTLLRNITMGTGGIYTFIITQVGIRIYVVICTCHEINFLCSNHGTTSSYFPV